VRTFRDPAGRTRSVCSRDPRLEAFEAFMKTDAAAEAMRHDGVRGGTILLLAES
jgi:hypothetical protein